MIVFQFIRKYKILHIIFWIQAWYSLSHTLMQFSREKSPFIIYHNTTFTIVMQMVMVYTIVYLLLPRFFYRKKYVLFVVSTLATIFAACVLELFLKELSIRLFYNPAYKLNHAFVLMGNLIDGVKLSAVFIILYLAEYYFLKDQRNAILEKQHLQTELDFLKSQINPHFLFNALNSLHVIMREDTKLAEKTLLEFSGLLRYQLYECDKPTTTLGKEIGFISNFIELEKLRYGNELEVEFSYPDEVKYREIAPFVLIPFIENAFKHVSHHSHQKNHIKIQLADSSGTITLEVENSYDAGNQGFNQHKGIGLENVKRRLSLLYPQKHQLTFHTNNETFGVKLKIDLNEN
ncbi:MAG: histidine kinase [Bacteroidia bacterium]|nr:histidine kinase [Bacteroidia bacterium]